MRLYIAGPMTGLPEHNLPAFAEAEQQLLAAGYKVINPGFRGDDIPGWVWADYLRADLALLLACDGVALLPGWESSRGARLEAHVAEQLDMAVKPIEFWFDCAGAA